MNPLLLAFLIILLIFITACLLVSIPLTKRHTLKDAHTPAELALDFRSVHFPSADGLTLAGWWIPAEESPRTVIFLHGFSGTMDPDLKYVPAFHERGFNVLMFDFRAHGRSRGERTSLGAIEVQDVFGALDFARACNSWSVGLLGFSMGGRAAILAAANCKDFAAVVSDGGPLRLSTAITADMRRRNIPGILAPILSFMLLLGGSLRLGTNLFWNDPLIKAKKVPPTPVLLIHGDQDHYTRISELEKMKAKMKGNVKIWRSAGARHREVDLADLDLYLDRVIGFFEEHMPLN